MANEEVKVKDKPLDEGVVKCGLTVDQLQKDGLKLKENCPLCDKPVMLHTVSTAIPKEPIKTETHHNSNYLRGINFPKYTFLIGVVAMLI